MSRVLSVLVLLAACDTTEPAPDPGRPATTGIAGTEETCVLPDVGLAASAGPGGANIVPASMYISFDGLFVAGQPYDYRLDTNGDGDPEEISTTVTFHINDSGGNELCTVQWDASDAAPGSTWKTPSGLDLSSKFRLQVDPATAVTDCPPIDASVYGLGTVPEVLATLNVEVGVSDLVTLLPDVQIALAAAGENFVADWSPYIMGVYVKMFGTAPAEVGYTRGSLGPCDEIVEDVFVDAPESGLELPRGRFVGLPLKTVPFIPANTSGGGTTTDTIPTTGTGDAPIGSYKIEDGPDWHNNPTVYNCLEACAIVFGGDASEYHCSTKASELNFQAYVSGYGDDTYCTSPKPEDYKVGTNYNCGSFGCAYSAYVLDNCNSGEKNFCWK